MHIYERRRVAGTSAGYFLRQRVLRALASTTDARRSGRAKYAPVGSSSNELQPASRDRTQPRGGREEGAGIQPPKKFAKRYTAFHRVQCGWSFSAVTATFVVLVEGRDALRRRTLPDDFPTWESTGFQRRKSPRDHCHSRISLPLSLSSLSPFTVVAFRCKVQDETLLADEATLNLTKISLFSGIIVE